MTTESRASHSGGDAFKSPLRTALVTGATGFIGSALAQRLARSGVRVTCLVRPGSVRIATLSHIPGITVVESPTFDSDTIRAALSYLPVEVVFHLASYGVQPNDRDEEQLALGNVVLTERLLMACRGLSVGRFIFSGTCSEYGPVAEPELLSEVHALAPSSPYGAAKAEAEVRGISVGRELGIPFIPLRLFGVYGVGEAPLRLIPYVIAQLLRGDVPSLTGGEQVRDLMYVDDMVDALVATATAPGVQPGTAYNVCTGTAVRVRAVAERVAALLGKAGADLGLGRLPYRADEAMWIVGDPMRFMVATGWKPTTTLTEGIHRMIAAARSRAKS